MKYDYYIGIDPDSVKSGVACIDMATRRVEAQALSFFDAIEYIEQIAILSEERSERVCVVVEAGWLNESNWHLTARDNKWQAAAKGRSLGRCEQTGRLLLEAAERIGADCIARKPLRKCWRGKDRKITHEEIVAITGIDGRTNQEGRDALLLAWVEANLPIRISTKKISQ